VSGMNVWIELARMVRSARPDGRADIAHQVAEAGPICAQLWRSVAKATGSWGRRPAHANALKKSHQDTELTLILGVQPSSPTATTNSSRHRHDHARIGFMARRPANIIANITPNPAAPSGSRLVTLRPEDSADRGDKRRRGQSTIPITNISTVRQELRSLKITTGMKGFLAVSICTTNR